jgi:hypothetical protein
VSTCPRCGASLAGGQEYCLECGLRIPGPGRLGSAPGEQRRLGVVLVALLAIAIAGAGVAMATTWEGGSEEAVITATGGSVTATQPDVVARGFNEWPRGRDGWTIVLVSVPKTKGARAEAVQRATRARARGLPQVGIVDSGKIASLHPGYWIVFTGVYDSEPEAAGALQRAKTVVRTATPRRMAA